MQTLENRTDESIYSLKHPIRLLLIEDSASDVAWVKQLLCTMPMVVEFEITDVPRMSQAFERLDRQTFDLALLDLNLLDISGIAAVTALHAHAPHVPIIVYSGCPDKRLLEEALLCGAKHYLSKERESIFQLPLMIRQSVTTHAA